ncbi:hypothetical protein BDW74DRAFT_101427 [Aspergillus multicolor]|uniref:uncharacterized protein n=1 Tax=Aspergillus multicolor TaxID=41759 RepID=UPI003CCE2B53
MLFVEWSRDIEVVPGCYLGSLNMLTWEQRDQRSLSANRKAQHLPLLAGSGCNILYSFTILPFTLTPTPTPPTQTQLETPSIPDCRHRRCKQRERRGSGSYLPDPTFWNGLTKIWLTNIALRELRRRTDGSHPKQPARPTEPSTGIISSLSLEPLTELRRYARAGGPDVLNLRNYTARLSSYVSSATATLPTVTEEEERSDASAQVFTMSGTSTADDAASGITTVAALSHSHPLRPSTTKQPMSVASYGSSSSASKHSSAYDENFEEVLAKHGVYTSDSHRL